MGLFGSSNDDNIVTEVEKATSEKHVDEDWGTIMTICDKAGKSSEEAKTYLRAIVKRLQNLDPHVGLKAVTLLDACVKNSGKTFHIELASREFERDFTNLMTKAAPPVARKLRESLKKWVENEFKSDPQLNLIPSLYSKLKSQYDFAQYDSTPIKKPTVVNKDPDVVESQEEEDEILKAIELSLKETKLSTSASASAATSLYPSVSMATPPSTANNVSSTAPSGVAKEQRKVRALYDFEAAEDNELTFHSGEIILIIDDSDRNWWKGSNHRGEGLFPANFVTTDLSVEPEKYLYEKAKKVVQFKENAEVNLLEQESTSSTDNLSIDEGKIDRLLHLLHEADPTNPEKDTQEFLNLEREVIGMGPLVDAELERVDRKHAQLTQLSSDLVEAFSLYHTLMREPQFSTMKQPFSPYHPGMAPNSGMPPAHLMGPPQHYNMPPQPHSMQHLPHPVGHLPPGMAPNVGPMPQGPMPHPHMVNDQYGSLHNFPPAAMMPPMGVHPHMGGVVPQNSPQQPPQQPQQLPPHFTTSSTHIMH